MQAVHHHSLGQRFVNVSAPAVMLPEVVAPMGLSRALAILSGSRTRMREAIWTMARVIPPAPLDFHGSPRAGLARYPRALLEVLDDDERRNLQAFEECRGDFCREAELVSAAIIAYAPRRDA